jgi:hypothetical protein
VSRFTEDLVAIPAGTPWIPCSPSQLLLQLGVRTASRPVQRRAVAGWLAENEPTSFLRMGLETDGLVDAGESRHSVD